MKNGKAVYVWVTTQFVAYHRWLHAPDQVDFLRDYHRHVFHVRLAIEVNHNDREVEFFTLKEDLEKYIKDTYTNHYFEKSCEMIAQDLVTKFKAAYCTVSEDGENGATVFISDPNVYFEELNRQEVQF